MEVKSGAGYTPYYYHADGLGSITGLSDATGTMVQTYGYDAFGNVTASGSVSQPFMFTAREYDAETGMYFYRARYYDPQAGRFVTKDPIGFAGGDVNLFAYINNNPVIYNDPFGLMGKKPTQGEIDTITKPMQRSMGEAGQTMSLIAKGFSLLEQGELWYYSSLIKIPHFIFIKDKSFNEKKCILKCVQAICDNACRNDKSCTSNNVSSDCMACLNQAGSVCEISCKQEVFN